MPTPEDVKTGKHKINIVMAQIAPSGEGKTHNAATFPKSFFAVTGRGEDLTFTTKPELLKNVVEWQYYIPSSVDDTRDTLSRLNADIETIRKRALDGEIETYVLDNLSFLARDMWNYIEHYEAAVYSDQRAKYGRLSQMLYNLVKYKITSLPCNVVINMHLKVEDEDSMKKKADKTAWEVAAVLGGFRNELNGLVDIVAYLQKIPKGNNTYKYLARMNKGNNKAAKSRITMPEVIEDISYTKIMESYKQGEQ